MGRPKKYRVILTEDEVSNLKKAMRKKETCKTVQKRCQILLDLDEGQGKLLTYEQAAKTNCVCIATVEKTAKQYATGGIEEVIHHCRQLKRATSKRT